MTDTIFVDTSALFAVLDGDDDNHQRALRAWSSMVDRLEVDPGAAITHSGVVIESAALVQRRLGMDATRDLLETIVPSFTVVWIDEQIHRLAVAAMLAAGKRQVSLVDWTSFTVMRDRAITHAFAFDNDFERQGFQQFEG